MVLKPVKILSLLLACLYIYGGSGFSLADFCCSSCKDKGIEILLAEGCHQEDTAEEEDSCCASHSERESNPASPVCKKCCDHINHCNVTSYQFDLDDTVYKHTCQIPVFELAYFIAELSLLEEIYLHLAYKKNFTDPPVSIYSSRDILTKNSVLLI